MSLSRVVRWLGGAALLLTISGVRSVAWADTTIDGGELGGLVWTADKGPYHVNDTAGTPIISAGKELRIQAGTVVMFGATSLTVTGKLVVEGSAGAPVVLQGEGDGTGITWSGIVVTDAAATVQIAGAIIRNASYGVVIYFPATVHIDRTTVESCTIGLSVWQGTFAFDALVLRNNSRGIEVEGNKMPPDASVTLTNALLRGNKGHGAQTVGTSPLTIINATIDGNGSGATAWYSGAAVAGPSLALDVQNTIFTNNVRAIDLNTITVDDASRVSATIKNSTFWNNGKNSEHQTKTGYVRVAANEVPAGTGNAVADPRYVGENDLHLGSGSPCVDSGEATRAPNHDLEGNVRPQGVRVDRGAYEGNHDGAGGGGGGGGAGGLGAGGGAAGASGTGGAAGSGQASGGGGASGAGVGGQSPPGEAGRGGGGATNIGGGAAGGAAAGKSGGAGVGGQALGAGGQGGNAGQGGAAASPGGRGCDCALGDGDTGTKRGIAGALLLLMIAAARTRPRHPR